MSAFLCSDMHAAAVSILAALEFNVNPENLVTQLRAANNAALAHRYGDKPQKLKNKKQALAAAREWLAENPAQLPRLRTVECFEYQCSEGETLKTRAKTARILRDLQTAISKNIPAGAGNSNVWSI